MNRLIHNMNNLTPIILMKNTHTLEQVEALMWKESDILMDPNVGKERKKEALRNLKNLEKHFINCKDKEVNGKKYPVKIQPKDIPKKELLALIYSVETPRDFGVETGVLNFNRDDVDVSGVSVGSNRFTYIE